ncbi:hypothetical protein [Pleionea mediterranea]|uniref:Uncharacterized protein n=1 Tax=Pleionea mediterranea TaxID=523701 RepID=A0A316FW82_9GAMM|nr:hypothetical protein [Pleionea mediterranea]PWK52829.1 hypothetical protein C8D97_10447 [Pleionea mediterranea]
MIKNRLNTLIFLSVLFYCSVSNAYITADPNPSVGGSYTVSWTESGDTYGCGYGGSSTHPFRLSEYQDNGVNQVYRLYTSYINYASKPPGKYTYQLTYRKCTSSGEAYFKTGLLIVEVYLDPNVSGRKVEFIHTDLNGSPAATSDETGEINE